MGSNCMSTFMQIKKMHAKYYTICGSLNLQMQNWMKRTDYKVIVRFLTVWGSAPLTPVFKEFCISEIRVLFWKMI